MLRGAQVIPALFPRPEPKVNGRPFEPGMKVKVEYREPMTERAPLGFDISMLKLQGRRQASRFGGARIGARLMALTPRRNGSVQ